MAVDRLVGDVEPPGGETVELLTDPLPLEGAALRLVIGEVRGAPERLRLFLYPTLFHRVSFAARCTVNFGLQYLTMTV